ncbi:MAG: hypothetical protein KF900_05245, partial [Bacteroidetes bacterium]|nr:hypothetical protein [Bacteroidota bacterium]
MRKNYFLKAVAAAALTVVFFSSKAQITYTFTNCGATGQFGPTQIQVNNAYNATSLQNLVTVTGQGIQSWTVPVTGNYGIRAIGASGGTTTSGCTTPGGLGANMYGEFSLTAGQVLQILVGQMGVPSQNSQDGGGGGGTFVVSVNTPLIVAGGGGGATSNLGGCSGAQRNGLNASLTTSGTNGANGNGAGGTNGNGGTGTGAGAGGGFLTNGTGGGGNGFGRSFMNGGIGGNYNTAGPGGFGGGGSGFWEGGNGGGGGGYSGGGTNSNSPYSGGGGGGSYNSGINQTNALAAFSGHGMAIITPLIFINIAASSTAICSGNTATLTASGVSTYTWLPVGGFGGSNSTTIAVSPTVATVYTVQGTNSSGMSTTNTVLVNVFGSVPSVVANAAPNNLLCSGNTATINYTGTGVLTHTWSNSLQTGVSFIPP